MNALLEKYPEEIQATLAKYPPDGSGKRSAVMPILYIAQRETGYVTREAIRQIAELCEISTTEVASMIGFYTLFHAEPDGQYRVQVCTDLPCALRGAEQLLNNLCENLGIKVGDTTSDGKILVESVMCLAGCHNAPIFQVQSADRIEYHENQTVESALEVINQLRRGG